MNHENCMAIAGYPAHVMSFIHNRLGTPGARSVGYNHHKEILDVLERDGMVRLKHHDSGACTMRRTVLGSTAKMIATRMFDAEPLTDKGRLWVNQFGHHEFIARFPADSEELMDGLGEAVEKGLYLRGEDRHYRTFMGRHLWHQLTGNPRPDAAKAIPEFDYAELALF